METDINRLKVVLAEKKKTNKWLCEQLNVNPSTVSKWCSVFLTCFQGLKKWYGSSHTAASEKAVPA